VVALLCVDRKVAGLAGVQMAQLAGAVATLTGGGGGGVFDTLRSNFGLANLDITSDEDGTVGVRAGAYLNERTYVDVEAGSDGQSTATINLDITRNIRGRASIDTEGESQIGIFYEKDY